MKKNVASQVVGAQLNSKTDGSAITSGTTTCYVTGDGGTQAAGSVGSGACTHEGQGFWTYAPAQAETNYDHVAFTFVNTNAVGATVQIYTSFPQTGDSFARLGAPVGASISADIAGVQSDTDNIQTRLPAALVSGRMDSNMQAAANGVITAAVIATDAIDADAMADGAITAATFAAGAIDATAIAADAIGSSELAASAVNEIADQVWDELLSGHVVSGSAGEALAAAGTAGDPWTTALPGAYGAGTAGKIIGDNINATISSRAAQTTADAIETDTQDIQSRLPAALVGGRIDANAGAISGDATAADNLEAALDGTGGVTITAALTGNITGNLSGSVGSVTGAVGSVGNGGIAAASFAAGAIDAAAIAANAIGASELAADAAAEIATAVRTELATELGRIDVATSTRPTAADNADKLLGRTIAGAGDGGRTVKDALRILRNKTSIAAGTLTVTEEDDATPAWTAAVTTTAGNPISAIDPA